MSPVQDGKFIGKAGEHVQDCAARAPWWRVVHETHAEPGRHPFGIEPGLDSIGSVADQQHHLAEAVPLQQAQLPAQQRDAPDIGQRLRQPTQNGLKPRPLPPRR